MRSATTTVADANSTFSTIPIATIDKGTLAAALHGSMIPSRREITSSRDKDVMPQILSRQSSRTVLAFPLTAQPRTRHLRCFSQGLSHRAHAFEDNVPWRPSLAILARLRSDASFSHIHRRGPKGAVRSC